MSLIASLMDDYVDIERRIRVQDSTGSWVLGPKTTIRVERATVMSPYGVVVGSSFESTDAALTVTTKRVLVAPLNTNIRPDDVILHDGRRYSVEGEQLEFKQTSLARMEIQVEEVNG
ncbi:hypothetical protein ACFQ8W_00485 [Streptomyces sp. NPDC056508]|uniref:hypothetical protein n=1 Tax=Streptomyces sp. NPDC056508 TaxID=3345845 RepID=UPI00368FC691